MVTIKFFPFCCLFEMFQSKYWEKYCLEFFVIIHFIFPARLLVPEEQRKACTENYVVCTSFVHR